MKNEKQVKPEQAVENKDITIVDILFLHTEN